VSHIVTVKTEIRDPAAIQAACRRLNLADPVSGRTQLFSGEVEGLAVKLPEWQYPVVCDTAAGKLHYDNFGGRWGDQKHLDRFLQMYSVEKAKIEARKRGHQCFEQQLADGSIKLTIQLAGGTLR
jgi:hypothetical protein